METIQMGICCDVSSCAIEEAILMLPPARHYELRVAARYWSTAKSLYGRQASYACKNPFCSALNIILDETEEGWSLSTADQRVNNRGIP
jgi:hypothetical protein